MRKHKKIIGVLVFAVFAFVFGAVNIGVSDNGVITEDGTGKASSDGAVKNEKDTTKKVAEGEKETTKKKEEAEEETTKKKKEEAEEETTKKKKEEAEEETTKKKKEEAEEETTKKKKEETEEETTKKKEDAEDKGAPLKAGFYIQENNSRVKYTSYKSDYTAGSEIASIDVFATDEDVISNDHFGTVWRSYWEQYENAYQFKIGYTVVLYTKDYGTIKKTILDPDDAKEIWEYMEVYLYDDAAQAPNTWYSHLTKEEMTDDTYVTSVKLRCGVNIAQVKKASLRAFYYKGFSQFDEMGEYTGDDYIECKIEHR